MYVGINERNHAAHTNKKKPMGEIMDNDLYMPSNID